MKSFFIGAVMGACSGSYFTYNLTMESNRPYLAHQSKEDLNKDGIPDMTITLNNTHEVPLLGVYNGAYLSFYSTEYLPFKVDSDFKDYGSLEDEINKHPLVYWWGVK